MSFRPVVDSAVRALRALSDEAAKSPLPPIDWDRLERRLMGEVAEHGAPEPSRAVEVPRSRAVASRAASPWGIALVAAAAVALVYGARPNPSGHGIAAHETQDRAPVFEGAAENVTLPDALQPGDAAESGSHAIAYHRPGVVSFTLAPESRIEVVSVDREGARPGSMTVALVRGSIHAEVVPRTEGEVFAVEVDRTRIAVHGTSFTVSREGDRAIVDVAHGSVAVGPAGHPGSTHGWLLVGPERASFSVDGGREVKWLVPPARAADANSGTSSRSWSVAVPPAAGSPNSEHRSRSKTASVTSGSAAAAAPPESIGPPEEDTSGPREPPAAQKPTTVAPEPRDDVATSAILKGIEACYDRQVTSFGVQFSIRSSLTLAILPNGLVREGVFDPPLSPTLMACAREAVAAARYSRHDSVREIRVPVIFAHPAD